MKGAVKKRSKKAGLPPGSLVHLGESPALGVKLQVMDYDENRWEEREISSIKECLPFRERPTVTWINVEGLSQVEVMKELGEGYGLHPLVMEDILATDQRPKMEDHGEYLYIVLKMLRLEEAKAEIRSEQISLVLGPNFVISFQEGLEGDVFDPVRNRIRNNIGRFRKGGADSLAYSLLDAVVDNYFIILERVGEQVEILEENLIGGPAPEFLAEIHRLKKEMIILHKSVWPLREVVNGMQKADSPLIRESTRPYLRDIYDHTIQVIETVEIYRDLLAGLLELHLSTISNKLNEIMKVLTIISTIFIPLTFIAGVYGMNFKNMPELKWHYGYYLIWGIMLTAGMIMLLLFKRKKWL